jgi:hypothetical protein
MRERLIPEKRLDKNGRLVTRHVRQESRGDAGKPLPYPAPIRAESAAQADAETVIASLVADASKDVYYPASRLPHKYSVEQMHRVLSSIFDPDTLRHAADLVTSSPKQKLVHWMLRGMIECAEEYLDRDGWPPPQMTSLAHYVKDAVDRARVMSICSGYNEVDQNFHYLMSVVQSESHAAANQALRDDVMFEDRHHEHDQNKFAISLLILKLIYGEKSRSQHSYKDPSNLKRVYEERDRILPHLPEFQKREAFNFDLLDEMERSSSRSLNEGIL